MGQVLEGRFRILGSLRRGGMAQLYLAGQDAEPRQVAVKVMHHRLTADAEVVARFAREARLAAKLVHPNIVRLVHVGEDPRRPYFAMELLAGQDLSVRIKQRRSFAEVEAATIAIDVARALAHAHGLGVVHRDIKPGNVMMCPGEPREEVKLLDFGIAKVVEVGAPPGTGLSAHRSPLTVAGSLVGTPRYMAPEQAKAESVDARTDLYALGVLLYELVTGSVPFDGETALQILSRHVHDEPRPPSALAKSLHPDLERLILDLLKKDPSARPRSAEDVGGRLQTMLPSLAAFPDASTRRWMRPPSRVANPAVRTLPMTIHAGRPKSATEPLGQPLLTRARGRADDEIEAPRAQPPQALMSQVTHLRRIAIGLAIAVVILVAVLALR